MQKHDKLYYPNKCSIIMYSQQHSSISTAIAEYQFGDSSRNKALQCCVASYHQRDQSTTIIYGTFY